MTDKGGPKMPLGTRLINRCSLLRAAVVALAAFAAAPAFGGYGPKIAKGKMGKRVLVNTDQVGFLFAGNEKGGNTDLGERRRGASPFTMNHANAPEGLMRLESRCPRGKRPL